MLPRNKKPNIEKMRNNIILGLVAMVVGVNFTVAGRTFTIREYANENSAAFTIVSSHRYNCNSAIAIDYGDTLRMENGDTLGLRRNANVTVYGNIEFVPNEGGVVMPSTEDGEGANIILKGDSAQGCFKNVVFEKCGVEHWSFKSMTVEHCEFNNSTTFGINFRSSSPNNVIRDCKFYRTTRPAVIQRSFIALPTTNRVEVFPGILFENNYVNNCNTSKYSSLDMVDLASGGKYPVIVKNNVIEGGGASNPETGGMTISQIINVDGGHHVEVKGNKISNCGSGITFKGGMDIEVSDNELLDNRWSRAAMIQTQSGWGIGLKFLTGLEKPQYAKVSRNRIDGHLWGIQILVGDNSNINMGKIENSQDSDYNEGGNVFTRNGTVWNENGGDIFQFEPGESWSPDEHPYDIYVYNSNKLFYAQGNTWGSQEQTEAEIAKRIFGNVIFMPTGGSGVSSVDMEEGRVIYYTLEGVCVGATPRGRGIYIEQRGDKFKKVVIN